MADGVTWLSIYPTGRKHCSCCKRWRHGIDFGVRKWADEPYCTVPRLLASVCTRCIAAKRRARYGYNHRDTPYPYGIPGSPEYRAHRNAMNRESNRRRRKSKKYRELSAEYSRIWYNAKKAEHEEHKRSTVSART